MTERHDKEMYKSVTVRFSYVDEDHGDLLQKLSEESERRHVSKNKLIIECIKEHYAILENGQSQKLDSLSALNALLNMDEKGNDGIDMDEEPKAPKSEKEVADCTAKNIPLAKRVSLKAKLEVMKAKVAGGDTEKPMPQKARGKEETL